MHPRSSSPILFCVALLSGCGNSDPQLPPSPAPFADARMSAAGLERWARTCAMCHVRGEGGAPKVGDRDAWATRIAQGETMLLEHTVNGLGNMPPLGYCMDCEREDLRAAIAFMINASR